MSSHGARRRAKAAATEAPYRPHRAPPGPPGPESANPDHWPRGLQVSAGSGFQLKVWPYLTKLGASGPGVGSGVTRGNHAEGAVGGRSRASRRAQAPSPPRTEGNTATRVTVPERVPVGTGHFQVPAVGAPSESELPTCERALRGIARLGATRRACAAPRSSRVLRMIRRYALGVTGTRGVQMATRTVNAKRRSRPWGSMLRRV